MIGCQRLAVEVLAPARLHLGFLDLHGGLGRRFGSLGLTLEGIATRLRAEPAARLSAAGPESERVLAYARAYLERRGIAGGADLRVESAIPSHAGLGSGTQLALAVGTALERIYGSPSAAGTRRIADVLGRGRRSGIGIGAFDQGGFIVDCGRGDSDAVPPLALRLPFPDDWRLLLLLDRRGQGIHGEREVRAFAELAEFPESAAGRLCRVLLMQVVPGLLECRLEPVAEGLREIQRTVGQHFAPAQGGCFASPAVAAALDLADRHGLRGSGQSSWGPTGFVLAEDAERARWLAQTIDRRGGASSPLELRICAARNRGAEVVATLQSARRPAPTPRSRARVSTPAREAASE